MENSRYKLRVWDGEKYHYDIAIYDGKAYIPDQGLLVEPVENAIIEQYVGLTDTNGEEICEGDIVCFTYWWFDGNECESDLTGIIIYSNKNMSFQLKGVKNKEWEKFTGYSNDNDYLTPFSELNFCDADFEIIGNINETPELLKDESS